MSKRAKEKAKVFQDSLDYHQSMSMWPEDAYLKGYEQAEKETIERAIAWLKEHANEYIVDLTPTYPDAPVNIIVGGMCWEHLKTFLENE